MQSKNYRTEQQITGIFYFSVPSSTIRESLGWTSIRDRFDYFLNTFMFKILSLFNYSSDSSLRPTRATVAGNLLVPRSFCQIYDRSLSVSGANSWNKLPYYFRTLPNLYQFKKRILQKYL